MRLSGNALPIEKLSPTSLATFAACPEQWRRKYLHKEPELWNGDRFMGSVNHDTVAEILKIRRLGGTLTEQMPLTHMTGFVREHYRNQWQARLDVEGEPFWNSDDPIEMYARGLQMALAYTEVVVPTITPLAVEEDVEMTLPGLPLIRGRVDVIEPDKIRERKTTAVKQTTPKPRWRFQARIYQLIVGLPVEWDVITRQSATKIYSYSEEFPDLRLELVDAKVTAGMIRTLWAAMNDCYDRYGQDGVWPLLGQFGQFDCNYCRYGPRHHSDCAAWA